MTTVNPSINTTQWNRDTYLYYGDPTVITFVIILIIVMVLAIGGNILVLATLARHRGMRTRTNLLLANLAVADIIVAITDIPFAINTLIYGTWPLSHVLCEVNAFCVGLGLMVSVHTLMWISVHKFISITRPFSKIITTRKIVLMILLSWGWCIFYNLTPVIGWTDIIYRRGASQCGPTTPITLLQRSHSITNTVFNMVVPFTVMIYCYFCIFREVRAHLERLQSFTDVDERRAVFQQKRITKTLFIVLACFLLCWTPYILYSNIIVFRGDDSLPEIVNPIAYLFGYMNSACNPIIYALRSPSFRKGFGEIICGPGRLTDEEAICAPNAANEINGEANNIDELQNCQDFTPQILMDYRERIENLSSHENYNKESNNLAAFKKFTKSVNDIENTSYDSKPQIIKTSSNISVYANCPKLMDKFNSTSIEKVNIKEKGETESKKEIELMCSSSTLCKTELCLSVDYKREMNKPNGLLPEVLSETSHKSKSLKNMNCKHLDIHCINKHIPYQEGFLHAASAGDLKNAENPMISLQTECSKIPAALKWQASTEDLTQEYSSHRGWRASSMI